MALRPIHGLSLCSGAGGLDLALDLALPGYAGVCFVEREGPAAALLVSRMEAGDLAPAPVWSDLAAFDGRPWRGVVDICSGGYPCQPFSMAGKRRGVADPRHLWPHIARIVAECEPGLCFFENVAGHLSLGFEAVASDLEGLGYRVAAGLFTAAEVGASHRRERLFILAALANAGDRQLPQPGRGSPPRNGPRPAGADLADADHPRQLQPEGHEPGQRRQLGDSGPAMANPPGVGWREGRPEFARRIGLGAPDQRGGEGVGQADADGPRSSIDPQRRGRGDEQPALVGSGRHLFPPGRDDRDGWTEYLAARPDAEPAIRRGSHGLAGRVDRLGMCGNGVVPLAGAYAFRTLADALGIDLPDLATADGA